MRKIPFYIESSNGHDTVEVPEGEVQGEVEKQLVDGRWVTVEKQDGETEILTEKDMPKEEKSEGEQATLKEVSGEEVEKTKDEEWAEKFEKTESVTATQKAKGG